MSPTAHVFHAGQLRDLADGKSYARGEQYHREGRVSALSRENKTITATVSGTKPYEVKLWVNGDRIAYACSCPMGEEGLFCKHCVAVALSLKSQLESRAPDDDESEDEPQSAPSSEPVEPIAGGATIIQPPAPFEKHAARRLFLAGSIDQGKAVNWQAHLCEVIADVDELVIYNPRRDDWDDSWEQSVDNEPFVGQVTWELDAMERADVIAMYFAPKSRSPITLLELGLHAAGGKLIVCCAPSFWRKGNVDVVCRRYGIHQTHDLDALGRAVRARLRTVPVTPR